MKLKVNRYLLALAWVVVVHPAAAQGTAAGGGAESCRKFVQEFYDSYLKQSAKGKGVSDAIKVRRSAFSPEILRALKVDAVAQAKHPNEIVGLDFDPIFNGQDFANKYVVGKATNKGTRYLVEVFGIWNGKKDEIPSVTPELTWVNSQWRFQDFHYQRDPKKPSEDSLLSVLKALREERRRLPDGM